MTPDRRRRPTRPPATASPTTSTPRCSSRPAPARARPPRWSAGSSRSSHPATVELRIDRRHHLHREGRRRAARPAPARARRNAPRRRRRPREVARALPRRARPARRRRHRHAARLRPAPPRPSTRSRRRLPPRVEVLDEVQLGGRVRPALGRASSTSCSTTPTSSARSSCSSPPGVDPRKLARRWPSPSSGTGTSSRTCVPEHARRAARRSRDGLADASSTRARRRSPSSRADCIDPTDKLLRVASDEFAGFGARARGSRRPTTSTCSTAARAAPRSTASGSRARRRSWRAAARTQVHAQLAAVGRRRSTPSAAACSTAAPTTSAPRCAATPSRRPTSARAAGTPRVPRPARAGPQGAARPRAGPGRAGAPPRALPAAAARRVPGHRPDPDRAGRAHRRRRPGRRRRRPTWREVDVAPGRLFVVGDPKQSIYRFRRADIATFLAARDRFAPEAGGAVELTANFRTVAPDHRLGQRTPSRAPARGAAPTRTCPPRSPTTSTSTPQRGAAAGRARRWP